MFELLCKGLLSVHKLTTSQHWQPRKVLLT